ncbi:MAG: hypothetical protein EON58_05200 [Alphaproteobacteria bacterium]|nr:MAG: hypothetical protein EON58_05200 [Alphaproteobacteria bacterium]
MRKSTAALMVLTLFGATLVGFDYGTSASARSVEPGARPVCAHEQEAHWQHPREGRSVQQRLNLFLCKVSQPWLGRQQDLLQ